MKAILLWPLRHRVSTALFVTLAAFSLMIWTAIFSLAVAFDAAGNARSDFSPQVALSRLGQALRLPLDVFSWTWLRRDVLARWPAASMLVASALYGVLTWGLLGIIGRRVSGARTLDAMSRTGDRE